jgi:hypothetical protein
VLVTDDPARLDDFRAFAAEVRAFDQACRRASGIPAGWRAARALVGHQRLGPMLVVAVVPVDAAGATVAVPHGWLLHRQRGGQPTLVPRHDAQGRIARATMARLPSAPDYARFCLGVGLAPMYRCGSMVSVPRFSVFDGRLWAVFSSDGDEEFPGWERRNREIAVHGRHAESQ